MKNKKKTDYLKFINYSFKQNDNVFKINTDTALLGMFLEGIKGKTVLDIGTGSGALLLYAHYHKAGHLIGVDIQKEALKLAKENISKYTNDYELINSEIQSINIKPVDVIVCNPPFFEKGNMRKSDNWNKAMFEETLSLDDMFSSIRKNLIDNGCAFILYPAERFPEFYSSCIAHKMKIMKLQFVHDNNRPYASRFLCKLKIGPQKKVKVLKPIIVKNGMFSI